MNISRLSILASALSEPFSTAVLLAIFGILVGFSVVFSRAMSRLGVPVVLLFLVSSNRYVGRLLHPPVNFVPSDNDLLLTLYNLK